MDTLNEKYTDSVKNFKQLEMLMKQKDDEMIKLGK